MQKIKIALESLGCRVNKSEGDTLLANFSDNFYKKVSFYEYSDIYIVNTCTITSKADSKSRKLIRKAKNQNKNALVVVIGCYAQTNYKKLSKIKEIDLIIGIENKKNLVEIIENFNKKNKKIFIDKFDKKNKNIFFESVSNSKTRAFIKIQDGCNSFCSYCIIPFARGTSKSNGIEKIIMQINKTLKQGYKEIILTGINIGMYGKDLHKNINLNILIKKLLLIKNLKRIRIGSIDPVSINNEFIEIFKNNKILPNIHISLQSGDNYILKKMNRNYNIELYENLIKKLREIKKDLLISTDIIVGFPFENEKNHINSIEFIKKIKINKLHIFKYSSRKGTKASLFEKQVEENIKRKRAKEMEVLSKKLYLSFLTKMLKTTRRVLIEKVIENCSWGYSENYIKVLIKNVFLIKNNIYNVFIINIEKNYLIGRIENKK